MNLTHAMMAALLVAWSVQDPGYESLIDRLRWSDPKDREQAAARLAAAGAAALPELDKAAGQFKDPLVLNRIEQVRARIRLKLFTPALDEGFSPGYRKAAPDLIVKLRHPSLDTLLEAIEHAIGIKVKFDPQLERVVATTVPKAPEATPSDETLLFRIALSVLPLRDESEPWKSVKVALGACNHLPKTATIAEDCLIHMEDPSQELRATLMSLSEYGQRRRHVPALLRLLDSVHREAVLHASFKLRNMNPAEYAPQLAARVNGHRATVIESLARTGDDQWKELFLKHVEDPDLTTQAAAVKALGAIDPTAAAPHVLRMLKSPAGATRMAGIHAVPAVTDARISRELEEIILKSPDEAAAQQALFPFGLCPPENAVAVLELAAKHTSVAVRRTASSFLGRLKEPSTRLAAGRSLLVDLKDPNCVPRLIEYLDGQNEQAAMDDLMKLRVPAFYEDLINLGLSWPSDRYPTVKEILESAASAMKAKGYSLDWKLAVADERPRIRKNSAKPCVALLIWLIPSTLGHEYGWLLEEGRLSLVPIDEARAGWREWARTRK